MTIRDLAAEGMTCILVTHEMGFAREIADRINFADRGVIVERGPPATFFEQARDPRTRAFLSQILQRRRHRATPVRSQGVLPERDPC